MIIKGQPVDNDLLAVQKSIATNLKNKGVFQSENKDTAENTIELHPPIPMKDCLYVFQNSSHVAKCCRILAADIIYNEITLTPDVDGEPSEKQVNQVSKINEFLNENVDELYNTIIRTKIESKNVYLLKQKINSTTHYFKIMGEDYPDTLQFFSGEKLGYASLIGGDNIYQFFSLPKWIQNYKKILTEIAIAASDYKTVSNGNISSGILNINLEPQLPSPINYDENDNPIKQKGRDEIISEELQSANGGTAVIFTESNRPVTLDYVSLANSNHSYLSDLSDKCQQAVLNDYNIPLVRLMINTEKESMNSDKTKSIWEIYTLNLKNEQKPAKLFIRELIEDLYNLKVNVEISTPIFSDRREIEVKLISQAWNDGALTLKQFIIALSDYLNVIDLNDYDFTKNPSVWEYRKIPELDAGLSPDDLKLIEDVEAQLDGFD